MRINFDFPAENVVNHDRIGNDKRNSNKSNQEQNLRAHFTLNMSFSHLLTNERRLPRIKGRFTIIRLNKVKVAVNFQITVFFLQGTFEQSRFSDHLPSILEDLSKNGCQD